MGRSVSVAVRKKVMSNSERLARQELKESAEVLVTAVNFCLSGWMKSDTYIEKVDTRHEMLAHILDVGCNVKINSDAKHAIL
jgi:hypothetical protein